MKNKLIGKLLIIVGLIGIALKFIEPYIIQKGCFGNDYFYETLTIGIPIILIVIGYKKLKTKLD